MKKFSLLCIFIVSWLLISCESESHETIDDDDGGQSELLNTYLVDIQLKLPEFVEAISIKGARLSRLEYLFGNTYEEGNTPQSTNNAWTLAYKEILPVILAAEEIAVEEGLQKHLGILKVIKAYTMVTLVDFYGDVPYSEISEPNPSLDNGAFIYNQSIVLLNEAINALEGEGPDLQSDFYYDNNFSKWIKLANTLKLNMYLNTRLIDQTALDNFNLIIASGDFISSTSDDFQFNYGNSAANSALQHPAYKRDYSTIGTQNYRSNWLMDVMLTSNDPRRRCYFYRQFNCTPGNNDANGVDCSSDPTVLGCSVMSRPAHFPQEMVFCSVSSGYWGRDHGFSGGIPPDTYYRSAIGVYPAAGVFDDNDFGSTAQTAGGQGLGITPIMLASWVDFMRAEMALSVNNSAAANSLLQIGIQKSIDKAIGFITVDPDADTAFIPSSSDISTFISTVANHFATGSTIDKWNVLTTQQFVANYGNGISSFNTYRRTGYPSTIQYHVDASPGAFPRSLFYPLVAVDENSNIDQKQNLAVQVFWDNNPSFPTFPIAN